MKGERGKGEGRRREAKIKYFNSVKRFPLWPQSKLWRQEKSLDSCLVCLCLYSLLTELSTLANLEFYRHTSCLWDKLSPLGLPYLFFPPFPKGNASSKVPNPRVDIRWQPRSSRNCWSVLGVEDWFGDLRVNVLFLTLPLAPCVLCPRSLISTCSSPNDLATAPSVFPQTYLPCRVRMTFEASASSKYVSNSETDGF